MNTDHCPHCYATDAVPLSSGLRCTNDWHHSRPRPHPGACRYCHGTAINLVQPDYLVRCAELRPDGTIVYGDPIDGADFPGPSLLTCLTCNSVYVAPADVEQVFDGNLEVDYSDVKPLPDEPSYSVAWTPVPTGPVFSAPHPVTARG